MNRIIKNIKYAICVVLTMAIMSCDNMFTEFYQCDSFITFQYDYNMQYVDRFQAEAEGVNLFVFDQDGYFVSQIAYTKSDIQGDRMKLPLEAGMYQILAWAGYDGTNYASTTTLTPGVTMIRDVFIELVCEANNTFGKVLPNLWHGLDTLYEVRNSNDRDTIYLTKDTQKLIFTLENIDGTAVDIRDLNIEITEANGVYCCHNHTERNCDICFVGMPSKLITYRPYRVDETKTKSDEERVVAEMSFLRLLANTGNDLVITFKSTGDTLIHQSLTTYLDALRLDQYNSMSLQEYMDREDEYRFNLAFRILESNKIGMQVTINGWYVREEQLGEV